MGDPGLGGLPFGPLVAIEAQLGVVGKIRTELQEERAEVRVHAGEVELVDQPGGLHDPRVGVPVGVATALGAKQYRLLLRPPDEGTPSVPVKAARRSRAMSSFLALDEVHPRHALVPSEATHRRAERVGDLGQRGGGSNRQVQLLVHAAHNPGRVLQPWDIDVEVHPVDALDLEAHMLSNDIGHGAR